MGQRNRVQRFKDPRHKSFLYGGVCSFVCMHHDPSFYSCTGDWVNEIACLPHEARVPEDWRETTPSLLPRHMTQSKSGNQKPKTPPWLLHPTRNILPKIHQLTRKEVKCRATSTEISRFHFSELLGTNYLEGYTKFGTTELWLQLVKYCCMFQKQQCNIKMLKDNSSVNVVVPDSTKTIPIF